MRSRRRNLSLTGAFVAALWAAVAGPLNAAVVERILAVVDGRPLFLSEVRVLGSVRGVEAKAALEAAVDEKLMYQEAARAPQAATSSEEEQAAFDSLVSRIGARAVGIPELDLRNLARREATILKYIRLRFLPQIRIDDDDVRRAYEAETAGAAAAPSLEEAEPGLRQQLTDKELDQRIEAWVRELRSAADVRYNDPP
jgi:hypothetical protein